MLVLAQRPEWVGRLPHGKLPDRSDFLRYGHDLLGRIKAWTAVASASQALADEFSQWLQQCDVRQVEAL